jgi:hypothetical protein
MRTMTSHTDDKPRHETGEFWVFGVIAELAEINHFGTSTQTHSPRMSLARCADVSQRRASQADTSSLWLVIAHARLTANTARTTNSLNPSTYTLAFTHSIAWLIRTHAGIDSKKPSTSEACSGAAQASM